MAKTPPVKNSASIVMISGSITVNGVTHDLRGVDYHRTEYADGTVRESGRPPDLPAGASVSDVIAHAFTLLNSNQGTTDGTKPKQRRRRRAADGNPPPRH